MRVIDEKGRLFGKINIIDFLVILLLVFSLPMFYVGYKIFTKNFSRDVIPSEESRRPVEIELDCLLIGMDPETARKVSVGDREIEQDGRVIGEITWLGGARPYEYEITLGGASTIQKQDPVLKEMPAKLKLSAVTTGGSLYYKEKRIDLNSSIDFVTTEYTVEARPAVDSAESSDLPMVFLEIEADCLLVELNPELIKEISVGDQEIDQDGRVIGEITWLGEARPYEYEITPGGTSTIKKQDPILKEMPAKLKLSVVLKDNSFYCKEVYYKEDGVTPDYMIEFNPPQYSLRALIKKVSVLEGSPKYLNNKEIILNITFKNLSDEKLSLITVGDKEYDAQGRIIAEVIKIGDIEPNVYEINLGDGSFISSEDATSKQITVKMKILCQITKGGFIYFKQNKVNDRSKIEFKTDKYLIAGKIAKDYSFKKWIKFNLKFKGIPQELVNVIKAGDTSTDSKGEVIAKLEKINSIRPSEVLVIKERDWLTLNHPFNKDIEAEVKALCTQKDGVYYFNNYPVKIGNDIVFSTDTYSLQGAISELQL